MSPNAEPIEAATVIVASLWLALVVGLLVRWCAVWPRVGTMPRPDSMRLMVAIRLVGYSAAMCLALIVLGAGALQAVSPRPLAPSPWREFFQIGWLAIACSQVFTICVIEWLTHRVMRLMEDDG